MAWALRGKKPQKEKLSVGSAECTSASKGALGPGMTVKSTPAAAAAQTKRYPRHPRVRNHHNVLSRLRSLHQALAKVGFVVLVVGYQPGMGLRPQSAQ